MDNNKDISLVKEAFDELQYKAPDIWIDLSQALDDELIDQKVAQSFSEQNFVAPTFDALYEAELDNSSGLAAALSDETGSGAAVFATSPTLTTPNIGTPSAGTLTNCTG